MLPAPGFHHLHLNSVDPDAAIAFYVEQFPTSAKSSWGGFPALAAPNNVLILFTRVATAAPTSPQTALWHFGWHVTDTRKSLDTYTARTSLTLLPLYTTDEGGSVFISSDSWPGTGGVPGRTKAQIAEAKAQGIQPARSGGFGYMQGPDDALVEYRGQPSGRALQPRAYVPGRSVLRADLVSAASQRAGGRGSHEPGRNDRAHLPGPARA